MSRDTRINPLFDEEIRRSKTKEQSPFNRNILLFVAFPRISTPDRIVSEFQICVLIVKRNYCQIPKYNFNFNSILLFGYFHNRGVF